MEIRITTAIAEEVEIFTTEGIAYGKLLAEAVKDELLSRPGIDVWSYIADMSTFSEGTTKIHVRVKHSDGRETISERMTVTVKHPSETTRRVLITSAPLPVLTEVGSGTVKTSVSVTASEREAILTRISDPSSCTNAEECKIYCRSLPGVNDLCVAFAQERLTPTLPADESLADDVSPEDLAELLVGGAKHSMDLPEYISDPAELKQYCAEIENAELCTKVFLDNDLSTRDALERKSESITRSQEERRTVFVERTGTRAYIDTDTDGVTDYDEVNIYNTDPQNGDTDNDGFSDGAELLARTNPSGGVRVVTGFGTSSGPVVEATTDESVVFANPMITGETLPSLLVVKNVEVVGVGTTTEGGMTAKKLKLAGTAGPNSFVTLYIFSEPIVVTVKADGAGAWVYTLDKELPDGTHQVYSAITDAGGRILAKSEPLPFVKSAAAVSLGGAILTPEAAQPGFFTGSSLYAMIAVLIGILGVALSIIGFIVRQKSIADSADLPGI